MSENIKIDTEGLAEGVNTYEQFDQQMRDIEGQMKEVMKELHTNWEGEEAELANKSFDKIDSALTEIDDSSNVNKGILNRKSDGFQNVMRNTSGKLNEKQDLRF